MNTRLFLLTCILSIFMKNAAFGYTPEEKFAIDQQNQNLTNAARFTARNLSGGSAAVALDNLKSAIMHTGTPNTDYKCAAVHPQVIATDNTDKHRSEESKLYEVIF